MSGTEPVIFQRLRSMERDLRCWRVRAWTDTISWREGNHVIPQSGVWATQRRTYLLACSSIVVPEGWPLGEARLELGKGAFGHVEFTGDNGHINRYPINDHNGEFPLLARRVGARAFVSPVRDSDTGYVTVGARWSSRLILIDPAVDEMCRLIDLVCDTAEAIRDPNLGSRLVDAAQEALSAVRWPTATVDVLSRVVDLEYLRGLWTEPALDDHPASLTADQRSSVVGAVGVLRARLEALAAESPASPGRVTWCGTAHIDIAWLWPEAVSVPAIVGHFAGALDQLDRFPEFRFAQSGAHLYRTLERRAPDLLDRLTERVIEGRWELLGGMWVEPDTNLPSGESLVRQLFYAQTYFQDRFDRRCRVCWLPDTFGFPGTLPQLLAGAGIEFFFTTKLRYADTNRFPFDLFTWEGIDGTRVLSAMGHGPNGYRGVPAPGTVVDTWRAYRQKAHYPEVLLPLGHSSGIGPTDEEIRQALDAQTLPAIPRTRFTSIERFFTDAAEATRHGGLPVWNGELYLEAHRGTFTTQGRTKVLQRRAEWALLAAESASALVTVRMNARPTDLTNLWHRVLDCQSHDVITGASIAEVHEEAEKVLAEVCAGADRQIAAAMRELAGELTGGCDGTGILLVNPTMSPRPVRAVLPTSGPAGRSGGGQVICVPSIVPPLGARWLPVPSHVSPEVRGEGTTLENEHLRVTVADDGTLSEIWDHRLKQQVLAGSGNSLVAYLDRPHFWDAWEIAGDYAKYRLEPLVCTEVRVVETGPSRASIRIVRRFRDSTITQDVRLWAHSARIDFDTDIDWHERHVLLRAYFPITLSAPFATYECPYGVTRRSTGSASSWERARFEVPAQRFVDFGSDEWGVALLNNGRYGHRVTGSTMSVSLLRSPVFPDPRADEGHHRFGYSLFPRVGEWSTGGVLAEAEDLNMPLLVTPCAAGTDGSWQAMDVGGLPIAFGAFKGSGRHDGLVLRAYEPAGAAGTARLSPAEDWRFAAELNLLEDVVGEPRFEFGPHQIHTWLVAPS